MKFKGLLGIATAGLALDWGLAYYFFHRTLVRGGGSSTERTTKMAGTDWSQHMPLMERRRQWLDQKKMEDVTILSRDGLRLHATWVPVKGATKVAICFHGYTSKGLNDFLGLAPFYMERGYSLLLVDQRAHGESEGHYYGFGVLDRWDALEWIKYADTRMEGKGSVILHGISMGGATVLMTSSLTLPTCVKAIVSDCAFTSAWSVFESVLNKTYHLPAFPLLHTANRLAIRYAGYDLAAINAAEEVRKAKVPILLIHGDKDSFVPPRMCSELYKSAASGTDILLVHGAGHGEAYWKDPAAYERKISVLLERAETQYAEKYTQA